MGWRHHVDSGSDMTMHVWPEVDVRSHQTDGINCWCDPRVEPITKAPVMMVVHRDELDRLELDVA